MYVNPSHERKQTTPGIYRGIRLRQGLHCAPTGVVLFILEKLQGRAGQDITEQIDSSTRRIPWIKHDAKTASPIPALIFLFIISPLSVLYCLFDLFFLVGFQIKAGIRIRLRREERWRMERKEAEAEVDTEADGK